MTLAPRRFTTIICLSLLLLAAAPAARAHSPVSADPFRRMGCTAGVPDLVNSYAVLGALLTPNQLDYICFSAGAGGVLKAQIIIPTKAAYDAPNDVTIALVGPGLPAPGRPVPGGLTPGQGAVFAEIRTEDGPFPQHRFESWWFGPRLDVILPDDAPTGTYEYRVFSPSGWAGEYLLTTTGSDPTSGGLEDTPMPTPGDIDQDGQVTVDDGIQALTLALLLTPISSSFALRAGDVAPPGDPMREFPRLRYLPGDGVIDLADATRIMRYALGLDNSPDWPD